MLISFPYPGKHMAFDGRHLHAAPQDISDAGGALHSRVSKEVQHVREAHETSQSLPGERTTFLVNVWLGHKPCHCEPISETRAGLLSNLSLPTSFQEPQETEPLILDASVERSHDTFQYEMNQLDTPHTLNLNLPLFHLNQHLGDQWARKANAIRIRYRAAPGVAIAPSPALPKLTPEPAGSAS